MPPLDFSSLSAEPRALNFDELQPESARPPLDFEILQPGQRTIGGLPMAALDTGSEATPAVASQTPAAPSVMAPATISLRPDGPMQQTDMRFAAPEQVQSAWQARFNSVPRGAIQGLGQMISGAAEATAGPSTQETMQGRLAVLDAIDAGKVLTESEDPHQLQQLQPDERKALRQTVETALKSGYEPPIAGAVRQVGGIGQAVSDFGQRQFPVTPENERDLGVMVGGGLGSFVPLITAGAVSGGFALPAVALAAGAQSYDQTYKTALEQNPDRPDLAHQAAVYSGLVGAGAMTVPVARFLSATERLAGVPLAQAAAKSVGEGGMLTGISQAQKFADNVIAANSYDPNRSALDGLGDVKEMAATTLTGALMPAIAHGPGAVRRGMSDLVRPTMDPAMRTGAEAMTDAARQARPTEGLALETDGEPRTDLLGASEQGQSPPTARPAGAIDFSSLQPAAASAKPSVAAAEGDSAASITGSSYEERAGGVVSRLMADLGLTREQAAGAVGNLGHESDGLQAINERNPTVPGSRGGFGWGQWTGERRDSFEKFSADHGLKVTDPEANYQFLVHELNGSESKALAALRQAGSLDEATRTFQDAYERPGIAATGNRLAMARKAFGAEAGPSDQPRGPTNRIYAGDIGIDTTPQVMELADLIASHDADGRVNKAYPHEDGLQPRDRSTVGSQAQVREIVSKLNPSLLAPSPDASGGAPIVSPDGRTVENGNGRVAALSLAYGDPALAPQAGAYRKFLSDQGYDVAGMKQPVLVSRRDTPLAGPELQQFIKNTADRATLAMTPAERGQADANLAGSAINLWQGATAGAAANAAFVRSFMAGVPPAERGGMIGPDGRLSSAGERRVQGAVVAHAYGDQLGPTLDRFLNDDAAGVKAISGGLTDAAGPWAQMRSEAQRGMIPPALDITGDLAQAVQLVDRARQSGRPVAEMLGQADFERPMSPMVADLARGFFRDAAMTRPAGREVVADRLKAYAENALKTQPGPDMFGAAPASAPEVLKAASLRSEGGSRHMLAARDAARARDATKADADAKTLSPEATEARERLRTTAQAMMRFLGLPEAIGLKLVDRIVAGAHGADGAYTRGLIELALDTKPELLPKALMHESVHALMDPELGLLTRGQRETLLNAADRWLARDGHRAQLEALYGSDRTLLREEAVARLGEEAFERGIKGAGPVGLVYGRLVNTVRGIGQVLRGQGYRTADDVFRGVLRGERALPGSREALAAGTGGMPAASAPAVAGSDPATAPGDPGRESAPGRVDAAQSATSAAIRQQGSVPDRYLSMRGVPDLGNATPRALPSDLPYRALMTRARSMLKEQRASGRVMLNQESGIRVGFDGASVSRPLTHAGPDLLRLIPLIPEVIEKGKYAGSVPGDAKHPHVVALHAFSGDVALDGKPARLTVTARELKNGRFVYSFDMDDTRVGRPADALSKPASSDALLTQIPRSKEGQEAPAGGQNVTPADADRKFAKRDRDTSAPLFADKAALERAGQGVIPGAEADPRAALQRQMDAALSPKGIQKAASDLPLFGSDHKQSRLFALRAFHGSPHDFDKFDIGKIGTGEGAQAFGHGLYFAENEKIARHYRNALTQRQVDLTAWRKSIQDMRDEASHLNRKIMEGGPEAVELVSRLDAIEDRIAEAKKNPPAPPKGSMYEVALKAEPHELLDWDKPLSQQSAGIQDALRELGIEHDQEAGAAAYQSLARKFADQKTASMQTDGAPRGWGSVEPEQYSDPAAASRALADAGVKGIRYNDAGSRGTEGGTSNYVMFHHDPVEVIRKYSLRQNLTTAVRDVTEEPRQKLNAMMNQALFPMRAGTEQAQRIAGKFANALRGIQFRYGQIDRQLVREFKPDQRAAMGRALDAQSVFEQRVRSGDATEADRAAFDAGKTGLAGLDAKQRGVVEDLNKLSQKTWQRMVDRGIVMPNAEGLPYYMPRQFVMMDGLAGARRITKADSLIEGGGKGGSGGGLTAMDKVGGNLSTSGPKAREHLTAEDSQAAARTKFGENVHLVTDIRSLLDAVRRQEQSVAGRDLIDAIKRIGVESGTDLVREGGVVPDGYFTLDHPSLWSVGPTGEAGPDGKPIYGRTPLHIDEQFRGPLGAVLSKANPDWYRGLMSLKSRSMTAIMFSPAMHLMVEVGRSLPLYHGNPAALISSMMRAKKLTTDRAYMDQAVADGLAPIGQGFGALEASHIVNEAAGLPKQTLLGKVWSGETTPQRAMHGVHQKLLWDNVFRLQTGIYSDMRTKFIDKGFAPQAAGIMAAHLANRYAGALPPEHLSRAANMAANVSMFSRSFTLGNLAVMKDMMNGAPSHVRAALEEAMQGEGVDKAMRTLQRKAISTFVLDIGMFYAMNALAQTGFAAARNAWNGDDLGTVASKAWQDYADHMLPQLGNEPGKEDRIYIGNDTAGTGVYGRTPFGKVGEEFTGWMPVIGHPGKMVLAKMNPLIRATWEAATGRDSLGRSIYNPAPDGILDHLKIAGQAVMHIAGSQVPADFVGQVYDAATGQAKGDPGVAAARILGPLTGFASISQGAKGGPEEGVKRAAVAHDDYERTLAKSEARRLYALGREDDARAALDKAYVTAPREAASAWRNIVAPERAQVRFGQRFNRTASAEARERVASVTGGQRP